MLNKIEEAIEDIRQGKLVIVVDNEDRENEGDFICAAETITPEIVNFMITHGRGLICAPIEESRAEELNLPLMVRTNTALHETAFTISVDLIGYGCTTGISTYDRALTIQSLADKKFIASDFARPGHIFPLRAKNGGVLHRTGHTEATIDLARLAGLKPAGALVEILNPDGTMARLPDLLEMSKSWGIKVISINDLVEYRMRSERLVFLKQQHEFKYSGKKLIIKIYGQHDSVNEHIAILIGDEIKSEEIISVRVQYCNAMAELLDNLVNQSNSNLNRAIQQLSAGQNGVILLVSNEEQISNTMSRLKPEENLNLVKDQREIGIGAQILKDLGIRRINLLTNQPKKSIAIEGYGLELSNFTNY